MAFNLTNPALDYSQAPQVDPTSGLQVSLPDIIKFFKNSGQRGQQFAKDTSKQVQPSYATFQGQIADPETVPTPMRNAGDTEPGHDQITTQMQDAPPPVLPKFVQPSFQDVSQGPMGTPTPINAGETKLGKLLHVVRAITQGGLEGSTQGTFGGGFKAASDAPYQDAYRSIGLQNAQLQNQQQQANIAMLPWQRAQQIAALQKTRAETQKEKFLTPRGGGVYDTSKSAYAPNAGPTEQNGDQQAIDYLTSNPDPQTGRPLTAPEAVARVAQLKQDAKPEPNPTEASLALAAGNGDVKAEAALKRLDKSRIASRPVINNMTPDDAKTIAAGIMNGDQPPTLQGLYRNAGPVRAELERQGFNLQKAETDWKATQKYVATLNGQQQTRLRQAVEFTSESIPLLKELYDNWKATGLPSGYKVFNRAALQVAKQLPGDAGKAANLLDAQISDLTSELGTVYKGGNSSTDESLSLAAKNLNGDWNDQTFGAALDQIDKNLRIRKNSMNVLGAVGVSSDSPYTPPSQRQPADNSKSGSGKYASGFSPL